MSHSHRLPQRTSILGSFLGAYQVGAVALRFQFVTELLSQCKHQRSVGIHSTAVSESYDVARLRIDLG